MTTYGPTVYSRAGWPKRLRTVGMLRPPGGTLGSLAAITKSALLCAGSYHALDDSQCLTSSDSGVTGATRTWPPVTTVVELACQYAARPSV